MEAGHEGELAAVVGKDSTKGLAPVANRGSPAAIPLIPFILAKNKSLGSQDKEDGKDEKQFAGDER